MSRTQLIEHPTYLSIAEAIDVAEKIVKTFKSDGITIDALASIMKHKNAGSGTFLKKLSDLKKYGIIDGRGTYYATQLAKDIAIPTSQEEKDNAIRKMIFNIEIIRKLHDALKSNVAPTDNDILIQLINITKEDKSQLQPILAEISNLYKDALPYISMAGHTTATQQMAQVNRDAPTTLPENVDISATAPITIADEGIYLKIVKDTEHLNLAKDLIDIYIKKLEASEKKPKQEKAK
jgi:hypothetical protein